jgi:hypothetical protein
MTALIWASFHGELEQVKDLVAKLTDINVVDEVRLPLEVRSIRCAHSASLPVDGHTARDVRAALCCQRRPPGRGEGAAGGEGQHSRLGRGTYCFVLLLYTDQYRNCSLLTSGISSAVYHVP